MGDAHHSAVLQWLAAAGLDDVTLSCVESPLDGSIVLDRCLGDAPLAWFAELAAHASLHVAVDHCDRADQTRERFRNLASITHRIRLDGDSSQGAQVHYASPPAREPGILPLGMVAEGPQGTLAERLVAALAALPGDLAGAR